MSFANKLNQFPLSTRLEAELITLLSFTPLEVVELEVVDVVVELNFEQKVRLSIKFALFSTLFSGDGVRDFSEASPPHDIDSSGDDADTLMSFNDDAERREVIVAVLTLWGLALTPIFETLIEAFIGLSTFPSKDCRGADATSGVDPEPVGALRTETSTN